MDQALSLIAAAKASRATRLDLGNCGLTELPDELFELVWLEELVLCDSYWVYDHKKNIELLIGSANIGEDNLLKSLSPKFKALQGLQKLYLNQQKELSDLSPLSGLSKLHQLDCSETNVSDLSPLSGLTNMQELCCYSTQVSDLSPLSGLSQLQTLSCHSTQVSDLSPLSELSQLQELYCGFMPVSDLSPLSGLSQLQTLSCHSTQVSDLSPLSGLSQLQTLSCHFTQVSDLSPLAALTQLQVLKCYSTQVSDLSPLYALTQLQTLRCNNTKVSDLSPLYALTQLQTLDCSNTQVSDLSPLSALSQLQILDCNSTGVSDLSPLTTLAQLQELYCALTPVSDLSPLSALTQLQKFSCADTQISDLSPLSTLTQLQTLNCSETKVSDLAPLAALTQLQTLNCNLTQVGDLFFLKDLTQLQRFKCSSMQVSDLSPLAALNQLQSLQCSSTKVSDLSPLAALNQLQSLQCSNTQVSDLSPLAALNQLQALQCSNTQVSDLMPLTALNQLQSLQCSNTQVSDLMPLTALTQLQALNCSDTQVSDLSPLAALTQLQALNCSDTQVSDLSPLAALNQLQALYCPDTQVSDLSPLAALNQLQTLYCPDTQVSDLSPLAALTQLQALNCSNTQVSDLTPLSALTQLQALDCFSTQVSDLSPLSALNQLQALNCSSTQVDDLSPLKVIIGKDIPVKWDNYYGLNGIFVKDCPLTNPPVEIVQQGNEAILNYWQQIAKTILHDFFEKKGSIIIRSTGQKGDNKDSTLEIGDSEQFIKLIDSSNIIELEQIIQQNEIEDSGSTVELYEAKMIIVGEGETGKTTLFEKMKDPQHKVGNTPETHGINILEGLPIQHPALGDNLFYVNLWDFGGQELQYMTHQFFLTPRAFYVLMMDARKESPNLTYWFKIISLLGKESQDSQDKVQLLMVFNKKQGSTGTPQYKDYLKYYEQDLEECFIEVDFAVNDYRFDYLMKTIKDKLVHLPIVKSKLPKQWKPIREALRKVENPWITVARLDEICSQYHITKEDDQWLLSKYLHQLGSILHFQEDKNLMDTVILSPEWAVDGVYAILKDPDIREIKQGRFTQEDIFKVLLKKDKTRKWEYSRIDVQKILHLMAINNFDICYQSDDIYIAPQHLSDNRPVLFKWYREVGEALQFRFQYPIMPKGLISWLIVRLSQFIERMEGVEIVWKKGAILNIPKDGDICRVLIQEDDAESKQGVRQIIIEVMGNDNNRKYALQKVRDEVEDLHKKWFRSIKADEIIPCCCAVCKRAPEKENYLLKDLLKLRQNATMRQCNTGEMVPIQLLLEGIYEKDEINTFDRETMHKKEGLDAIHKIEFNPVIKVHVKNKNKNTNIQKTDPALSKDLAELKAMLEQLSNDTQAKLKEYVEMLPEPENNSEKETTGKQILKWLNKNAEGITANVAASAYYDVLKFLFGIG